MTTEGWSSDDEDEKWMESLPQGPLFAATASRSTKTNTENASPSTTTITTTKSIECIEKEARKRVASLMELERSDYQRYHLSDFYWHSYKGQWYPCHRVYNICSIGPQPSRYQVPIQYIGKNWRIDTRIYFAKQRDLQPAFLLLETAQWCPQRVAAYRNIVLGLEKWAACPEESQRVACEEVMYLEAIRDVVVEGLVDDDGDEEDEKNTTLPAPVTMESENSDDDNDEEEEQSKLKPVDVESKEVVVAKVPPPISKRRKPRDPTKKSVIRVGDVIRYVPPHQIFCTDNMIFSTIQMVRVVGDGKGIALALFDGSMLPRDCRVQVLARFLRGKLQPIEEEDRFWVNLTDCRLQHGDIEKDPLGMESIHDKFNRLCNEVQDFANNYDPREAAVLDEENQDDDDDDESSVESSTDSRTKKPRATSLPTNQVEQKSKPPKYRSRRSLTQPARKRPAPTAIPQSVIQDLESKIQQCEKDKTKRRSDKAAIAVRENSLKIAIQVVHRAVTVDDLEAMASDWDVTRTTLENFINGNPKNLLRLEILEDLSKKFADFLAKGSEPSSPGSPSIDASVTASEETDEARDATCDTTSPSLEVPMLLDTSKGHVSNESNTASMISAEPLVAAPPKDTHDSAGDNPSTVDTSTENSALAKASVVIATKSEKIPLATASDETNDEVDSPKTKSPGLEVPLDLETPQAAMPNEPNPASTKIGESLVGSPPKATCTPNNTAEVSVSTSSENAAYMETSQVVATELDRVPKVATSAEEPPAPTPTTENSAPSVLNKQRDTNVQSSLKPPPVSGCEAAKANNVAEPGIATGTAGATKTATCPPSPGQPSTALKRTLHEKIQQCNVQRKKIKLDLDYIDAQERALQIAVRAGERNISENQIAGFAKAWGVTITTLQTFLQGSTEHTLSTQELADISDKFESVLAE